MDYRTLCVLFGIVAMVACQGLPVGIKLDIDETDGGIYGNYEGARLEYHCIDEDRVIQGMYGLYGAFWGVLADNLTAHIWFQDNNGASGEGWLVYAEDWSNVTGTYKYDGDETISLWVAINGVTTGVDWVQDCLFVSYNETGSPLGAYAEVGVTTPKEYYCEHDDEVYGSYAFYDVSLPVEFGLFVNGKTFDEGRHMVVTWDAKTGDTAGTSGPQLIKVDYEAEKAYGYWCDQGPGDYNLTNCYFFISDKISSTESNCDIFPNPLAALPISIALDIAADDEGIYGNFTGARVEYHCIDVHYGVQGQYGKVGFFYGMVDETLTFTGHFADGVGTTGTANFKYSSDWSNATGIFVYSGDATEYVWSAVNGQLDNVDWQRDCLYTTGDGTLDGYWKDSADTSLNYFCVDGPEITGTYKFVEDGEDEIGVYQNGIAIDDGKHGIIHWSALTGPYTGDIGPQIMKGDYSAESAWIFGYWCDLFNNSLTTGPVDCTFINITRVSTASTEDCSAFPTGATSEAGSGTAEESSEEEDTSEGNNDGSESESEAVGAAMSVAYSLATLAAALIAYLAF